MSVWTGWCAADIPSWLIVFLCSLSNFVCCGFITAGICMFAYLSRGVGCPVHQLDTFQAGDVQSLELGCLQELTMLVKVISDLLSEPSAGGSLVGSIITSTVESKGTNQRPEQCLLM